MPGIRRRDPDPTTRIQCRRSCNKPKYAATNAGPLPDYSWQVQIPALNAIKCIVPAAIIEFVRVQRIAQLEFVLYVPLPRVVAEYLHVQFVLFLADVEAQLGLQTESTQLILSEQSVNIIS
jgi:hypothetical protein